MNISNDATLSGFPRRSFLVGSLAAMATVALAACSPQEQQGADSTGPVSVMLPLFATAPSASGDLHKAIEKLLGRKLKITWVPAAEYPDRMTVTMASGNVPQILTVLKKDPGFVKSAQAGAFWDLTDKLKDYPNLIAEDPIVSAAASINGTSYGVFRRRDPMRSTAVFRQDWLDQLGLDAPETVEDLRTVAEAFVSERPGGDANSGLLLSQWGSVYGGGSPYEMIETWFGAPNGWGERGGDLVPSFDTDEFFEASAFLRKMREDGLLNADFATLTTKDLDNGFFAGKGGLTICTDDALPAYAKLFDQQDPDNGFAHESGGGNLLGPGGKRRSMPTPGYSGFLAISKQSVKTDAQLAEILGVLDMLNTPEGQNLQALGIEGKNYEMDGEFYVPIEGADAEVITNDATQAFYQFYTGVSGTTVPLIKPASKGLQAMYDARTEMRDRDLQTAVYDEAAPYVSPTQISQGATLNQIIGDARVRFIAGQLDEAGYRGEIARWHTSGGDTVIKEINELHAESR